MAVATSGVTRALRGRDASTLRGVAVRAPSSAPVPRVQHGAARTVCIAAGLEGGLDGGSSRDDAWEAAKRAAEDIKKRRPTTFNPLPSAAPKTGATDAELNHRYVDGGLQRDDALPLSLAYRYERLPQGDKTRLDVVRPCTISDEQSCKLDTQLQVWERTCSACNGSGFALSRGRRRGSTATCMVCLGIGAVRCSSTRISPKPRDGSDRQ